MYSVKRAVLSVMFCHSIAMFCQGYDVVLLLCGKYLLFKSKPLVFFIMH